MREILLTKGKVAIVDDADFELLSKWKWYYNNGYAVRSSPKTLGKQRTIKMHREINQTPDNMETDHINGNRLDNRRANLRSCTTSENQHNLSVRKNNKSGAKGVSLHKRDNKWEASITLDRQRIHLGYFSSLDEAAAAYDNAALRLHGGFAKTNSTTEST